MYDATSPRLRGRKAQARRLRIWKASPYCARCGKLCRFPAGFELDHLVPLAKDGPDIDENLQVLCVSTDSLGKVIGGCHQTKTALDLGHRVRVAVGLDGWPIEGTGGPA